MAGVYELADAVGALMSIKLIRVLSVFKSMRQRLLLWYTCIYFHPDYKDIVNVEIDRIDQYFLLFLYSDFDTLFSWSITCVPEWSVFLCT